jgi:hypothetical protein
MQVTERPFYPKSSFQIPTPSENVLLAVITVVFLGLHIAAGVILTKASGLAVTSMGEEAKASLYD